MNSISPGYPLLVGDIGGTNARFGLVQVPGDRPAMIKEFKCANYSNIHSALKAYLQHFPSTAISNVCIGIANPVRGDSVRMTNFEWSFSIEEVRTSFGFERLVVINDFKALATAVPLLRIDEYRKVGGGNSLKGAPIALLGAGTGLGVSAIVPNGDNYICLEGEGGHVTFPVTGDEHMQVFSWFQKIYGHVSAERALSGSGLEQLYQALAETNGEILPRQRAADITAAALRGEDPLALRTVDMFCGLLGSVAANLAITLGAFGGVYIGGGIVPKLGAYFAKSSFRSCFEDKGRFRSYMEAIPTYVIDAPYVALQGAALHLQSELGNTRGTNCG